MSSVIRISLKTKKILEELKIHPRETYEDVIRRLIGVAEKCE